MSVSLDRLRALRRQAGAAAESGVGATSIAMGLPQPPASPRKGLATAEPLLPSPQPPPQNPSAVAAIEPLAGATDLAALRRLLDQRERRPGTARPPQPPAASTERRLPGDEIAPGLYLREAFLPQPLPAAALSLAFARRPEQSVAPRDLLFFDTETTGLAGGTGTRAFMIGAADWHTDAAGREGLRVRQLLIATMAAEAAMLDAFATWLSADTVLVSYNGRCYDAPLLKTRYRLARRHDSLSACDHLDLLHPTRRRYRGNWENCRLATIERRLLGIVRDDDLPGSEAPAAWLSFLRGGDARNLHRVAAHNHQDVVTLARLLQRLVEAEQAERAATPSLDHSTCAADAGAVARSSRR